MIELIDLLSYLTTPWAFTIGAVACAVTAYGSARRAWNRGFDEADALAKRLERHHLEVIRRREREIAELKAKLDPARVRS